MVVYKMKLGLNGSTTDQCNLIEDIEVASQSGFDLLELRTYKINNYLNDGGSLENLRDKFIKEEVQPFAINALEFFTLKNTETEVNDMLKETEHWCKIASEINCPYLVAVPSRLVDNVKEETIIEDAVNMLLKVSDIAAKYDVKIAFEFIGFSDFSVTTLEVANEIITRVDRENVGLVIDTYHFYLGGSTLESVNVVDKKNIFIFHINDAEKGILKHELTEDHRVFPGIGMIPLKEIGQAFKAVGYNEMVSLELFRKDYWELPSEELGLQAFKYVKNSAQNMFS